MSEEETEKNDDGNVGTSLLTALFDTVENKESETTEEVEVEQEPVYNISDALRDTSPVTEEVSEEVVEPEAKEEDEKLTQLDKSLFEEISPTKQEEQEEEPVVDPIEENKQEEDLGWLTNDQQKRLDLVEFAESNFDEYKGKRAEYIEFFKAQREYLDNRLQEDPDAALDDSDYEYQNFLKRKKPKFDQGDLKKVVEFRTKTVTKQKALDELKPELDRIKEEQRKQEVRPVVSKLKEKTMGDIRSIIPESIRQVIESEGAEVAYDRNPAEYEIVNRIVTSHQKAMFAFHEITNGLTKYDPSDRDHVRLAAFIDKLEATMPEKDGKKFVNVGQYNQMSAKEKSKAYTLTPEEVVEIANDSARKVINQELNDFEEKLRKSGYVKGRQVTEQQQVATQPKPVKPQPRQGSPVTTQQPKKSEGISVTSVLGF